MRHFISIVVSILVPIFAVSSVLSLFPKNVYADEEPVIVIEDLNRQDSDEQFENIEFTQVDRVEVLKAYFEKHNSPLALHAETFVGVADKYGMDYRIMPAISGVESTFAKQYIPETHNPFGWGSGYIYYTSFDEAIEALGKGLYNGYVSKGRDTVEKIAPVYNPPHPDTWARNVNYFMGQISATSL
jgi:hypothetical protein